LTRNCLWVLRFQRPAIIWGSVVGVVAAAVLAQYLPALESGDDVSDAGPDPAVRPVVVVADDPAGLFASRW
jgi:hypothetical protein